MKTGKLLSIAILSIMVWGCNSSIESGAAKPDAAKVGFAVNTVAKTSALQAGYGISREVVADTGGIDTELFASEEFQAQMKAIGICDNFIELIGELGSKTNQSPRLEKVVSCLVDETEGLGKDVSGDAFFPIFDKCFCDGSGAVFGAILAYSWDYRAPALISFKAPVVGTYKAPVLPGYKSPSIPGYKAPSL